MLNTIELQELVNKYDQDCFRHNKTPSFEGLGRALGITGRTVNNIVKGIYKDGKPYTNKPHITRCIDNNDFEIIRELF